MNMLTAFDGSVLQMEIAWMCAAVVHIKRKLAQAFTPNKPWLSDLNLTVYLQRESVSDLLTRIYKG